MGRQQEEGNSSPMAAANVLSGICLGMRKEMGGSESGGQTCAAPDVVRSKSIASLCP